MAHDRPEDRRTWTTLQTKCGPVALSKTALLHKKVKMNCDINTSKHLMLHIQNIQNRDQTTNTKT